MTDYSEYQFDEEPEKPEYRTSPLRAGILTIISVALCAIVWINQVEIRNYYFPPEPVVNTNNLTVEDINNEEAIILELEAKYPWLWIMSVRRISTGTVTVLSGIHPDHQAEITAMPQEEWRAVSIQATRDIINAFAPASRNGIVYMLYAKSSTFQLVGVLQCDTLGSTNSDNWACQGQAIDPPLAIKPDALEYSDRLE